MAAFHDGAEDVVVVVGRQKSYAVLLQNLHGIGQRMVDVGAVIVGAELDLRHLVVLNRKHETIRNTFERSKSPIVIQDSSTSSTKTALLFIGGASSIVISTVRFWAAAAGST